MFPCTVHITGSASAHSLAPIAIAIACGLLAACAAPVAGQHSGAEFRDCEICPAMVVIPAGSFQMGTVAGAGGVADRESANESPAHEVTFARPFAIGKFEVTRREFAAFVAATGRGDMGGCLQIGRAMIAVPSKDSSWQNPGYPQTDDGPALCVGFQDAQAYVEWLAAQAGQPYRLPSEAEWEYAARAGVTTSAPWGDVPAGACALLNGRDARWDPGEASGAAQPRFACDDGHEGPADVGGYPPNAFGLYDMIGNVSEWTQDCNHSNYAGAPADGSAWMRDSNCVYRVVRGGSFRNGPNLNRFAARLDRPIAGRAPVLGLRVARSLGEASATTGPATAAVTAIEAPGAPPADQELFRTRCAGCHVDLASLPGKYGRDRASVERNIREGVAGGRSMPAWGGVLSADEIARLAEFVRLATGWR